MLSVDLPPTKIKNVETFVERLIQDTFFEAFQEYYILKNKNETGKTNLAYETTEDDVIITIRRKFTPCAKDTETLKATSHPNVNKSSADGSKLSKCVHKKVQKVSFFIFVSQKHLFLETARKNVSDIFFFVLMS